MKTKTFLIIAFLMAINSAFSQSIFDKWPEMKSFHEVMSQTFHPAEDGKLGPLKTLSEELKNKAEHLLNSNIPEEYRTKAILKSLEELQIKSQELNKLVLAKAPDEQLTKSITELHHIFHEIVGLFSEEK